MYVDFSKLTAFKDKSINATQMVWLLINKTLDCLVQSEPFIKKSCVLSILKKEAFENTVGKGENAGNQHFLLFPLGFQPYQ